MSEHIPALYVIAGCLWLLYLRRRQDAEKGWHSRHDKACEDVNAIVGERIGNVTLKLVTAISMGLTILLWPASAVAHLCRRTLKRSED
jgi:hypothetical protein